MGIRSSVDDNGVMTSRIAADPFPHYLPEASWPSTYLEVLGTFRAYEFVQVARLLSRLETCAAICE